MYQQIGLLVTSNFPCYINSFSLRVCDLSHTLVSCTPNGPLTIVRYDMLIFPHNQATFHNVTYSRQASLISCNDSVVSKGAGYITSAITSTKRQCALFTILPCLAMDFCRKYDIKEAALRPAEKSNLFFAMRNFTAPTYFFSLSSHRIIKSGATVICKPAIIHSLLVTLGKVQCILPTLSGKLISMKCLKAVIEFVTSFFAHTELVWRDCKI